jgi:ABC-type nitrate/sulfonate/bicarbonate transport system permease component
VTIAQLPLRRATNVDTVIEPVEKRRTPRNYTMLLGAVGIVFVLAAWQVCASTGLVDATFSSSPAGALAALWDFVVSGDIWSPLGKTLTTIAWGLAIAIAIGVPVGLLIGRNRVLYGLTEPLISIMYSVPYVVFLPIIIFWFGLSSSARITIVVWGAVFPLLINVITGARNLDVNFLHVSQVFCASRLRFFRSVAFPATLPYILSGIRQAVGRGLVASIVAELFMGSAGLGFEVLRQTTMFEMDGAMARIGVIAVIAVVLTKGIGVIERQFTSWSTSGS